jgi:transposase InsO family protein
MGVKLIMDYLREQLAPTEEACIIDAYNKTTLFKRKAGQGIKEYVAEFEMIFNESSSAGIPWHDTVKAFMFLQNSKLTDIEYKLIKTNLNIKQNIGKLYKLIKGRMLELLTNSMGDVVDKGGVATADAYLTYQTEQEQHEVLVAQGWKPPRRDNKYKGYNKVSTNYKPDHRSNNKPQHKPFNQKQQAAMGSNRVGIDGKRMQCIVCKSTFHLIAECPHAKKTSNGKYHKSGARGNSNETYVVEIRREQEEKLIDSDSSEDDNSEQEHLSDTVWYTAPEQKGQFVREAFGCGAFDTGCTASVAGEVWFNDFIEALSADMKERVVGPLKSGRTFMFGNQGTLSSGAMYKLPCLIRGEYYQIEVDIIKSNIPLLISRKEMARLDISINNKNDTATMKSKPLPIMTTTAGHLIVDLLGRKQQVNLEEMFSVRLLEADEETQIKTLDKIHKQFGHRSKRAFVEVLKTAENWHPKFSKMINKIISGCEGCIMRKRNPDRPAVALPMSNDFNQVVTMDLKIWRGKYILYLIDSFTRYTMATVVKKKEPSCIVDAIMDKWIQYFGKMDGVLTDNGGEFSSALMLEVLSILDVVDHTTGAESPWSNGLCEKNHALADNILQSVMRDYPDLSIEQALAWAVVAKNSLTNHFGFSPYQLVFGRNPKLPNVINDPPPSWEIKTKSESLMKNLRAMHATRQAFMKAESCEKLKIALRAKIRTNGTIYQNGDIVYYKRDNEETWRGPAKVAFQDGKVIFIRHGGYAVRVSANRLVKAGTELERRIREEHEEFKVHDQVEKNEQEIKEENRVIKTEKKEKKAPVTVVITEAEDSEENEENDESERERDIVSQDEVESSDEEDNNREAVENNDIEVEKEKPGAGQISQATEEVEAGASQTSKRTATSPAKDDRPVKIVKQVKLKANDRIEFKDGEQWLSGTVMGRAGKATTTNKNWYNLRLDNGRELSADTAQHEVRKLDDEQALYTWVHQEVLAVMIPKEQRNSPECLEAKKQELKKLADFETYTVVEDKGQPSISTTWVLTEKGSDVRARLTARGYEESDDFPKDSPTMQKFSFRILLTLAAINSWVIETTDIKSAFLQGSKLDRLVYVKPPREAEMKGKLWRLEKCLYGLKDASRQWYLKVALKLKELGFERSKYDLGLFYKLHGGKLIGLIGLHVDDFLTCGGKLFKMQILPQLLKHFQVGKSESGDFMYTGYKLVQNNSGIKLDQVDYVTNINVPALDAERLKQKDQPMDQEELSGFRGMVGTLNWTVGNTRPDLTFEMISLSTRFKGGKIEDLIAAKKALVNLQRNAAYITISNVQPVQQCEIWCFSDAAFRNLNDGVDSAGGYVILIVNTHSGLCSPIDWKANKIKRKVTSTLAAETLSLGAALDAAVGVKDMIAEVTNDKVILQIKAIVDNKSCRDAVYSTTSVTERRLRAEIAVIKEYEEEKIITEVKWIRGQYMLADIMTKKGVNSLPLMSVMQQGKLSQEMMAICK